MAKGANTGANSGTTGANSGSTATSASPAPTAAIVLKLGCGSDHSRDLRRRAGAGGGGTTLAVPFRRSKCGPSSDGFCPIIAAAEVSTTKATGPKYWRPVLQ